VPKVIKRKEAGELATQSPRATKPPRRSGHGQGRGRKPIIEKEIVGAEKEARRIISDAKTEAKRIVEEARQEAVGLREQGYAEGYEDGLGQYTEKTVRALADVDKMKSALEPEYIKLVKACVEKIIGKELRSEPKTIISIVRSALKDATQQREINVRVNPQDVETLRSNQRRLFDVLARAGKVEIREDDTVKRGGCIVVTELGTIDASLDRQLAALNVALHDELHASDDDPLEDEDDYDEDY
jgi:type III secretion protein L